MSRWIKHILGIWFFIATALPGVAAAANNASILEASSSVPSSGGATASVAVRIRVLNNGTTTWRAGTAHRLGASPSGTTNQLSWSDYSCGGYMNNVLDGRVFLCHDVAPGQTHDFQFNVRLPSSGVARLAVRMVQDGVQWFGETQAWTVSVSGCSNTALSTPTDRWKLEIFNNRSLSGSTVEQRYDAPGNGGFTFNWGTGRPSNCTGNDNFGVRFSRRINISTAGTYKFTTTTDDGVRLWVDGQLLIDRWIDQAPTSYSATKSLSAGWHDVRMDYYENGGGAHAAIKWEYTGGGCPTSPISTPSDRWKLEIFNNRSLSGSPVEIRTDAVGSGGFTFNWGTGRPSNCTGNDNFGVRFSRRINVTTSGTHKFTTTTDDGVRLWVDGQLLIDRWIDQAPTSHSATTTLSAGSHDVRMDYYENGGGAYAAIKWERTDSGCPTSPISTPSDRWKLEIFDNRSLSGSPVEIRTDAVGSGGFTFDWGSGRASNCTGNDNFSIRFSRRINIATSGTYDFTTTTDDGVRLWVDGQLLIDRWIDQAPTSHSATKALSAGWHDVRMDYYENGGGAYAALRWEGGGPSLPDVTVTRVWLTPSSPQVGDQVQFHATVKNQGSAPTPSGVLTGVGFAVAGYYGWGIYSQPIQPGQSVTIDHTSDSQGRGRWLPSSGGTYTVSAKADDVDRYAESNENNNTMPLNFSVEGGPDGGGNSRLGPHFLATASGTCADRLLENCPRVVKFMYGQGHDRLDEVKAACPSTQTVLRVYVPNSVRYTLSDEPTARAEANDFWSRMWNDLQHLTASEKQALDWLEGPNELDNLPDWYHNWNAAVNFGHFWDQLATRMHQNGFNPLVGSIAVGNPCMRGECARSDRNYFQPAADVVNARHGQGWRIGWSYHAYSQYLIKNVNDGGESSWTFRYRAIRDQTGLAGIPLVLTEGGQDTDRRNSHLISSEPRCNNQWGWQCRGTSPDAYMGWLSWLDYRLEEDPEVVGVTLYQACQSADWWSFNICDQGLDIKLRDHMKTR